jgi:hypothetical protein
MLHMRTRLGTAMMASTIVLVGFAAVLGYWNRDKLLRPLDSRPVAVSETATARETPRLSDAARQYIWEIEEQAYRISYKAGPRLTKALQQRDRAAVAQFFQADFQGLVFAADSAETIDREFAQFTLQKRSTHQPRAVNREEFLDWLFQHVEPFGSNFKVQLPLLFLSPVDAEDMTGAWHGTWFLRLYGATVQGGPREVVMRGQFRCDQLPEDLSQLTGWIGAWDMEEIAVAQASHVLMEEFSARCGIDVASLHDNWNESRANFQVTPGGVFACDYNQDGMVDLLVTDSGSARLYAGRGAAQFEDVTLQTGLPIQTPEGSITSIACAFADLDNDGDEDLIFQGTVFENRNGQFRQRGYLPLREVVGVSVADYDRDGLVDVYLSKGAPPPHQAMARTSWVDDHSGLPNQLFRNLGSFRFADVTDSAGASAGRRSTFTSVWLDADDDGWPDVYVINELGPNILLRNQQNGTFSEVAIGPGFDGFAMGVATGDVDGDGRVDIYIGNMFSKAGKRIIANIPPDAYTPELVEQMQSFVAGNLLLRNEGELRFADSCNSMIGGVGWAYGTAIEDLDGDGLLDLFSTAGFASFSRDEFDG